MKLESQITNNHSSLIDIEAQRKSRPLGNQSKRHSTPVENIRQITPYLKKQSQFSPFFTQKHRFHEKTNPIQTQFVAA